MGKMVKGTLKNPQFTIDEIKTAVLLATEASYECHRWDERLYPRVSIAMCDREALEPAAKVFGVSIMRKTIKRKIECPPELFPPDGRGRWMVVQVGKKADAIIEHLKPLLTEHAYKKWQETKRRCTT